MSEPLYDSAAQQNGAQVPADRDRLTPQEAYPDLHAGQPRDGGAPDGVDPGGVTADYTSESFPPAEGVFTPDVGPGGDDVDTSRTAAPGRYRTSSPGREVVEKVSDDAE
ncbi:hypothetical protein [Fodinicola acaciae]|uniref:hypothetical protein n=1 Tax=Fodinicola acaciae TaxID=2681555 RepID=UPI0013D33DCA|nr:hypothetical protein [Fodinicola acaciae]